MDAIFSVINAINLVGYIPYIEWWAAGFGIAATLGYSRQSMWCWPLGMVTVILYFFVLFDAKLYVDMSSQLIIFGLQVYGWWQWLYGGEKHIGRKVSRISLALALRIAIFLGVSTVVIGYYLANYSDGQLVYWDAFATISVLIGQWMIARKFIECWVWFMLINIIHIAIYLHIGLYVTAMLWAIYFSLAIYGQVLWYRELVANKLETSVA